MQLSSGTHIPDGLLAANALLSEKLHQGSATSTHTLHQGFRFAISHTSLGIIGSLYDGDVRSRCTGKERDIESGLDYFGARYYSSTMGRFSSPDWNAEPVPIPYADIGEPQSLNLYGYVKNNPLSMADPDGHSGCCDVLPTMEEVDAGIAYLGAVATAGAEFTVSTLAAPVVAIGGMILSPAQAGNDPAERRYLLMMSKGGKRNVRHTQFDDYTDDELEAIVRDPNAPSSLKQKAIATLKGRRQRNQQKRGGGGNKGGNGGRGGNNNNAGNNNNNPNRGGMGMVPFFIPDPPPPPLPPPKDKHGEPN